MSTSTLDHQLASGRGRMPLAMRLGVIALFLAFEKFLLSFLVDANAGLNATGLGKYSWIAQHFGLRFLVSFATALLVFTVVQDDPRIKQVHTATRRAPWRPGWLAFHALLMAPLAVIAWSFYGGHGLALPIALQAILWIVIGVVALTALLLAAAPWNIWRAAAQAVGVLWIYAALVGVLGALAISWSKVLWAPTAGITFAMVQPLVKLFIPVLITNPTTQVLDTGRFAVQIADLCSGLEGAGLLLAFCFAWLLYFRREYYFPRALLIIPLGLTILFFLNVLRIAALVLIGHAGYQDIAIYGFHSQAGWIAFNCTAAGLAYFSRKSTWFSRSTDQEVGPPQPVHNATTPYLLPFLTILAAGMLSRAASGKFETLYPFRVIGAGLALWYCWPRLRTLDFRFSWRGVLTGVVVFAMWLGAGHFLSTSASMPTELAAFSPPDRAIWLVARVLGGVLTVPIAEELAYRGFLLRRFKSSDFEHVRFQEAGIWALILSSVVFGIGHGSSWWLPGSLAGLAYGFVLLRTGRMGEAISAHATTNGLIAIWVVVLGQWELW